MKKEYMKPAMQVVNIAKSAPILAASNRTVNSVSNSDGFAMPNGGILDDEDDDM